jgi:hypothetical protein
MQEGIHSTRPYWTWVQPVFLIRSILVQLKSSPTRHSVLELKWVSIFSEIFLRRDRLTMGYFDNFDNEPLNKYKKIINLKIIDVFFYF